MVTPDQAIETIRETGGAKPGYRALHAKGKLYRGTFSATAEAAGLSRAAHLTGAAVPALIRFSNGSGNPGQPDNAPGVRGMAVKFTLPDGSTTDVSTQTAKLFPASTPDGFVSLLHAMRPGPTAPLRLIGYIATHPRFLSALPVVRAANTVPASYATVTYHGLHAFRWMAADGSDRFVRYHLRPAAGEELLSPDVAKSKGADFLIDELDERVAANRFGSSTRSRSPRTATRPSTRPNLAEHPNRHRRHPRDHRHRDRTRARRRHCGVRPDARHRRHRALRRPGLAVPHAGVLRLGEAAHRRRARSRSTRDLMTSAHGRPTAAELIAAVAEFLETDVRESTAGQVNFHSRVAANALRMVERELLADAEAADGVVGALARVGCVDEAQLAAAIRAGELDGGNDHVQSALRALVGRRLAAAHPGYQDE